MHKQELDAVRQLLEAALQKLREDPAEPSETKAQENPPISGSEKKVSHPGLERFTIEAHSNPTAPKACFMEPGRVCVNSGACEMRGF